MNSFCVLGLMSGTSLDGLDIAAVEFNNTNDSWQYKLKVAETVSYPKPLLNRLKIAVELSIEEHQLLDIDFGQFIGEAVNDFKTKHLIDIDFVCSHGHTSHHKPHQGITQQLGDAKAIYQKCKIPVINNFRALDVSLGGQGAPLVPIGDELLFAEYDFCLNLGGISNISYVNEAQRIAFDIGMANMPLNYLAGKFQKEYDKDGEIALAGEVNKALLEPLTPCGIGLPGILPGNIFAVPPPIAADNAMSFKSKSSPDASCVIPVVAPDINAAFCAADNFAKKAD